MLDITGYQDGRLCRERGRQDGRILLRKDPPCLF